MNLESQLCDSIYTRLVELVGGDRDMRRANNALQPVSREECQVVGDCMVVGFKSAQLFSFSHLQRMVARTYPGVDVQYNNGVAEISVPLVDEHNRLALIKPGSFTTHLLRCLFFLFFIALAVQWGKPSINAYIWNYLVELLGVGFSKLLQMTTAAKVAIK
jgi:hypothetical protein